MTESPQSGLDPDPLLDVAEAAACAGIRPASWRSGVSRGYLPQPDDPDNEAPKERRRPRWKLSTITRFAESRPGQGRRSDVAAAARDRARERAVDLAAPAPATTAEMEKWLTANHRAMLAVADVLVDHREALLTAAGDDRLRDNLAGAIDQAGEAMAGQPSRLFASAVTYAQFLLRPGNAVQTPAEVREILTRHAHLHPEFNKLRGRSVTA